VEGGEPEGTDDESTGNVEGGKPEGSGEGGDDDTGTVEGSKDAGFDDGSKAEGSSKVRVMLKEIQAEPMMAARLKAPVMVRGSVKKTRVELNVLHQTTISQQQLTSS